MSVKMTRQSTPANSLYYDAVGGSLEGTGSPPMSPAIANTDPSVDVARSDPLTTAQSPIQQNEFQHHGSVIRSPDASNPNAMPQPNPHNQQPSQKGPDTGNMRPVPVIYDESLGGFQTSGGDENLQRSGSQRSGRGTKFANGIFGSKKLTKRKSRNGSRDRSVSQTSHRSAHEAANSMPKASIGDAGGAFAMGAAMSAPDAEIHNELGAGFHERAAVAEGSLTRKQSAKIRKSENTLGKRISKIVKDEGKTEQQALDAAVKELADIQRMQQFAVKEETRIHTSHTKALHNLHNRELAVIKAQSDLEKVDADIQARLAKVQAELNKSKAKVQAEFDKAQAEVDKARAEIKAYEDHKEATRRHAMETTEWVKDKRKEVEVLRGWMGVDNREREAKLNELRA